MKSSVIVLSLALVVVRAVPLVETGNGNDGGLVSSLMGVFEQCMSGDVSLCLKETALNYAESFGLQPEISVADGVTLIGNGAPRAGRALDGEKLAEEPKQRESQIEERLFNRIADFMETHTLQVKLPTDVKRSFEEGRKKSKKLMKKLQPLLAILQLKFTALTPIFLAIIAAVAVKALFLLKIASLSTIVTFVRSILASKNRGSSSTYEAPPTTYGVQEQYPYPASNSGGWGRSDDDGQSLAYGAYATQS